MSLELFHHPWSRAATTVWALEEVGVPYDLRFVDLQKAEHKADAHRERNRMTKLPVLRDGDTYMSEGAAIALYLADRYALGDLAPELDDPRRGEYLRWAFFAPSVIEPACMARASGWEYSASTAGFGRYEDMVATLEEALDEGPYLLGEEFTMADVIVGATVRWMLQFQMLEPGRNLGPYAERLGEREALIRANDINEGIVEERGISRE